MKKSLSRLVGAWAGVLLASLSAQVFAGPLRIGYSDWPGWVAWEVAIEKGWFKEAGVDVKFDWFDYAASMEAFSAGLRLTREAMILIASSCVLGS